MIFFRRVRGDSMLPTYRDGDVVVGSQKDFAMGDIVVAKVKDREVIKRVVAIKDNLVEIRGDNVGTSTDSRHYGLLSRQAILGVIMIRFPSSQPAPTLRYKYGTYMGWGAAFIMAAFALVQLYRIDLFVPEMDKALPGGYGAAVAIAIVVVMMQVFALPFLMRMRLSVLASVLSGLFGVFVPLFWVLLTVWNFNSGVATPQFGEFIAKESTAWLLVGNLLWLSYAYVTLWALGFDKEYSPRLERLFKKRSKGTKKSSASSK